MEWSLSIYFGVLCYRISEQNVFFYFVNKNPPSKVTLNSYSVAHLYLKRLNPIYSEYFLRELRLHHVMAPSSHSSNSHRPAAPAPPVQSVLGSEHHSSATAALWSFIPVLTSHFTKRLHRSHITTTTTTSTTSTTVSRQTLRPAEQ